MLRRRAELARLALSGDSLRELAALPHLWELEGAVAGAVGVNLLVITKTIFLYRKVPTAHVAYAVLACVAPIAMFDLLNQWSKPMVFLAVLLTGVIRPAHGLFCLLSYFVGIHFAKLVRQVKGLLNHTRPVGGRKVSPGMVRSGSRCGIHGGGCRLFGQTCALAYLCVAAWTVCLKSGCAGQCAPSRTSRTAPRPSLTLCCAPCNLSLHPFSSLLVPSPSLHPPLQSSGCTFPPPHALLTTPSHYALLLHAPSLSLRRTPPSPVISPSRTA